MTFADIIDQWISYRAQLVELGTVRASTHKNQCGMAQTIKRGLGSHEIGQLRKSHVDIWLAGRQQTCAPVTVQAEMNLVRQILNWAVDEHFLEKKPRLPTVIVPNTEEDLPADEAFTFALTHLPAAHSQALEFMLLTGLAPHELERVQVRDFSLLKNAIGIGQREDFYVKRESRRRWVPLSDRAYLLWSVWAMGKADEAHPFPTVEAMQKALERLRKDKRLHRQPHQSQAKLVAPEGFGDITPKMMRKWFASKVAREHPEQVLQRLLGHVPGSPVTRRHYIRSSDRQLEEAVAGVGLKA